MSRDIVRMHYYKMMKIVFMDSEIVQRQNAFRSYIEIIMYISAFHQRVYVINSNFQLFNEKINN